MKGNSLKNEMEKIKIPADLHQRSKMGIQQAKLESQGDKMFMRKFFKPLSAVVLAAIAVVSIISTYDSSLASSIKGYFKDVVNWKGEVVNTEYTQATEEIQVQVNKPTIKSGKVIVPVLVTIQDITKPPFGAIEALSLGDFEIVATTGESFNDKHITVQAESNKNYEFGIEDSKKLLSETKSNKLNERVYQANLLIDESLIDKNKILTLNISTFLGHKKADAPLEIRGNWKVNISFN